MIIIRINYSTQSRDWRHLESHPGNRLSPSLSSTFSPSCSQSQNFISTLHLDSKIAVFKTIHPPFILYRLPETHFELYRRQSAALGQGPGPIITRVLHIKLRLLPSSRTLISSQQHTSSRQNPFHPKTSTPSALHTFHHSQHNSFLHLYLHTPSFQLSSP